MITKLKDLLKKIPFDTTQISVLTGLILVILSLIIFKPLKGLSNIPQLIVNFFLLFASGVVILQVFFKKDTSVEETIVVGNLKKVAEKRKELSNKEEEVVKEVVKKTKKTAQLKNTIQELEEEKNNLTKKSKKEPVSVKTAAKKLKNL